MCSRVTAVLPAPGPTFPSVRVGFVHRQDGQLRGTAGHHLGGPGLHHGMAAHCSQPCMRGELAYFLQSQSSENAPVQNNQKVNKHSSKKNT